MITLTLDFDHNDTRTYFEFCTWWSGFDVTVTNFIDHGLAGGNPAITFMGTRDSLIALVGDPWYGGDPRDHIELR